MNSLVKFLGVTFLISGAASAFAGWEPKDEDTYIKSIYVESGGANSRIYLRVYPVVEKDEACINPSGASLVRLEPSSSTAEEKREIFTQQLYASALAAYTANKPVRLKMNGCDDWDRPKAVGIHLK